MKTKKIVSKKKTNPSKKSPLWPGILAWFFCCFTLCGITAKLVSDNYKTELAQLQSDVWAANADAHTWESIAKNCGRYTNFDFISERR